MQISEKGQARKLVGMPDMGQVADNDCYTVRVFLVVRPHLWRLS